MGIFSNLFKKKSLPSTIYSVMNWGGWEAYNKWDKAKLIEQAYERNPVVAASVNLLARSVAGLPVKIETNKKTTVYEHEYINILGRNSSFRQWLEFQTKYYLVTGEAYSLKVFSDYSQKPIGVITLPSQYINPIESTAEQPIRGYRYRESGERVLDVSDVIYLRNPSLSQHNVGMSPLAPLIETIALSNANITWNKNIAQNGGTPQLIAKGQGITKQKAQEIRESWHEQSGANNSHRLKIVSENLEIMKMTEKPNDAEWSKSMEITLRYIIMGLGLSSELLNDASNKTYSNYKEARKALYLEAAIPLAQNLFDQINAQMSHYFADKAKLAVDVDAIDALSEEANAKVERLIKLVQMGILRADEARAELGYSINERQ